MLAAIVFTDVVGFSRLASQNEGRVYASLQRDMGVMTNLCRAHGGQVLNTMGDGMLLCFASAVDAMSCATEIQQTLYNQSLTLPQPDVLHHRIGVHLGDVIMNADNVFGDGVNVAARLQGLAKPDAVCFSGTVYEIVKNKLRLDAKYVGPRQLKNLGEPVKVWQISPLGDGKISAVQDDAASAIAREATETGARGGKAAFLIVACLALVGGLGFAVSRLKPPPPPKYTPKVAKTPPKKAGDQPPTPDTTTPAPAAPDATAVRNKIEELKKVYDFEGIVAEIDKVASAVPEVKEKRETFVQLIAMRRFFNDQLAKTGPLTTIPVTLSTGVAQAYMSGGQLYLTTDTQGNTTAPWPPSPDLFLSILASLVVRPADGSTAPSEGPNWVQLFSSEYRIAVPPSGT